MFIGHYGVSFAGKAAHKVLPLWLLFVAVQFLDVVWSVLVMLGIEKMRVTPGISASNSLDLYYMPFTHSLPGALALSILFGAATAAFFADQRMRAFLVAGGAVFSHWLLDLVVHVPDLPLVGDAMKVGFGLWNYPMTSLALELAVLWSGVAAYARQVPAGRGLGDVALYLFAAILSAVELWAAFGPGPASGNEEAHTALAAYVALAGLAGLVDRLRQSRPAAAKFLKSQAVSH
jgi:hypothetical protein